MPPARRLVWLMAKRLRAVIVYQGRILVQAFSGHALAHGESGASICYRASIALCFALELSSLAFQPAGPEHHRCAPCSLSLVCERVVHEFAS